MKDIFEAVSAHLFPEEGGGVFAVVDGAAVPELREVMWEKKPENICLYRGDLEPDMEEVAPYLVRLEPGSEFTQWLLRQGWGKSWCIFAQAAADLTALRQHFRKFLTVHTSEGQPLLFRYYDPRVLRTFLPTCKPEELSGFFGPVAAYLVEAEQPDTLLRFRFMQNALKEEKKPLGKE